MAISYEINYTDPLKAPFSLPASGMNGPGSANPQTTLRLYGRGATEWGESVDENFVRLLENFASATAPLFPQSGQIWAKRILYHIVGDVSGPAAGSILTNVYRFNLRTNTWEQSQADVTAEFRVVVIDTSITDYLPGAIGEYVYSRVDNKLYRWDSAYKQMSPDWMDRSYAEVDIAPTSSTIPDQEILVYNEGADTWQRLSNIVSSDTEPTGNYLGRLWYNPTTGRLYFWNGTSYSQIIGPSNSGNIEIEADLDMQMTYSIIRLRDPVDPYDAVNLSFVNNYVSGQASSLFLPVAGGTMTGPLIFNGTNEITFNNTLNVRSTGSGSLQILPNATNSSATLDVYSNQLANANNVLSLVSAAAVAKIESRTLNASTPNPLTFSFNDVERFRFNSSGALGLSGSNYGSAGSALISNGGTAAVSWTTFNLGSNAEGTRYVSTQDPNASIGVDGDIWYKVTG